MANNWHYALQLLLLIFQGLLSLYHVVSKKMKKVNFIKREKSSFKHNKYFYSVASQCNSGNEENKNDL